MPPFLVEQEQELSYTISTDNDDLASSNAASDLHCDHKGYYGNAPIHTLESLGVTLLSDDLAWQQYLKWYKQDDPFSKFQVLYKGGHTRCVNALSSFSHESS